MTISFKMETITGRIYARIFDVLESSPKGVHWSELLRILDADSEGFHPKTVNGCIFKLIEKYPSEVVKPEPGLFVLKKYYKKK